MENKNLFSETGIVITLILILIPIVIASILVVLKAYASMNNFLKRKELEKFNALKASKPEVAIPLYESFVKQLEKELGKKLQTGIFGADMKVLLLNDGPVTIVIDSKNKE